MQRIVFAYVRIFAIVETRAAQFFILQSEPQWSNKVQYRAGIRAKAYDISRIRRDFRFEQDQVEH